MRRPGSNRLLRGLGTGRSWVLDRSDGTIRHLIFRDGFVDIYSSVGALEATVAGPWTTADLFTMTLLNTEDSVAVFSTAFHPRTIKNTGSWTVANFAFRVDSLNRKAAPFYRFGQPGVTMVLSAYTGSGVTMTFSEAVLTSAHVGTRFMYVACQVLVTAFTNGTTGTVTIVDRLYPTVRVGVGNVNAFKVGDLCEGDVSNVRGQVVAIGVGVIDVVLTEGYTHFLAETADAPGEKLISTEASEIITTVTELGAPLATNIWFEELISAARGYPRTAAMHKARLVIGGFPLVGSLIATSAQAAIDDFTLGGGGDRDAILETIGEDPDAKIKHLVSTEQLLLGTDRGWWHVPEGGDRRFTPSGIGFNPISPDAASDIQPVWTPEGVVFLDRESRLILLSMTGSQRGAWAAQELSMLGAHLIKTPKQLTYSAGYGGRQERVIVATNGDGTLAVFAYRRGAEQAGWFPWFRHSGDQFASLSAFNGLLYCYAYAGGFYSLEEFDFDAVMDGEFPPAVTTYINETLDVLEGDHVRGTAATNGSGVHNYVGTVDKLGHDFYVKIEPASLVVSQAGRVRRRNAQTFVDVLDSGLFRINGVDRPGYLFDGDMEAPPPVRSREERGSQLGSAPYRTSAIEQYEGEGAPLHIRSITYKVQSSV